MGDGTGPGGDDPGKHGSRSAGSHWPHAGGPGAGGTLLGAGQMDDPRLTAHPDWLKQVPGFCLERPLDSLTMHKSARIERTEKGFQICIYNRTDYDELLAGESRGFSGWRGGVWPICGGGGGSAPFCGGGMGRTYTYNT